MVVQHRSHAARNAARRRAQDSLEKAVARVLHPVPAEGCASATAAILSEVAVREDISRPALTAAVAGVKVAGGPRRRRNVAQHSDQLPGRAEPAAAWKAAQKGPRLTARLRPVAVSKSTLRADAAEFVPQAELHRRRLPVFERLAAGQRAALALPVGGSAAGTSWASAAYGFGAFGFELMYVAVFVACHAVHLLGQLAYHVSRHCLLVRRTPCVEIVSGVRCSGNSSAVDRGVVAAHVQEHESTFDGFDDAPIVDDCSPGMPVFCGGDDTDVKVSTGGQAASQEHVSPLLDVPNVSVSAFPSLFPAGLTVVSGLIRSDEYYGYCDGHEPCELTTHLMALPGDAFVRGFHPDDELQRGSIISDCDLDYSLVVIEMYYSACFDRCIVALRTPSDRVVYMDPFDAELYID